MSEQYLKLIMGQQRILLPLSQVKLTLRLPTLHEVPNQTKGFEGTLNYHGVSVPVYNLGNYVGLEPVQREIDTPLILCQFNKGLLGLLVSEVNEVVFLEKKDIQTPELSQLPDFVQGTYESENESMWIIQLEALINPKAHLTQVADDE
ncbi:MAG: chemotaxis protein CheW [Legionella sp.]|nr:chemotaxis protein CheW [Legionella sp.]